MGQINFSGNGFPNAWSSLHKVPIPRFAVGIVIGRNGEMIKKIQNDAGVRIQFKPGEYIYLFSKRWRQLLLTLINLMLN